MSARNLRTMDAKSIAAIITKGEVVSAVPAETDGIAVAARNVLGYTKLDEHVQQRTVEHEAEVRHMQDRARLFALFNELKRRPFRASSVAAYMRKRTNPIKTSFAQGLVDLNERAGENDAAPFAGAVFSLAVIFTIASAFVQPFGFMIPDHWYGFWQVVDNVFMTFVVSIIGLPILYALVVYFPAQALMANFKSRQWRDIPIAEYQEPVPRDTLALAVKVKERIPEANILVRALEDRKLKGSVFFPIPDPFLVVELNGKTEVIDVWDELSFDPVAARTPETSRRKKG